MTTWPYPGDSPVARARRIAQAYRAALRVQMPALCDQLDDMMTGYGEGWVAPAVITVDEDQWLTPGEAADLACVKVPAIGQMRRRGVLAGTETPDGWRYRYRDVLHAMTGTRSRGESAA